MSTRIQVHPLAPSQFFISQIRIIIEIHINTSEATLHNEIQSSHSRNLHHPRARCPHGYHRPILLPPTHFHIQRWPSQLQAYLQGRW